MNELIQKSFDCQTKAIEDDRTIEFVISTDEIDRYGERVALDWDTRNFARNPVFCWAHDQSELPLGRCENVRVEAGALRATVRFAPGIASPKAEQCLQLYRAGILNAVSVGFISHSRRWEKNGTDEVLVLEKNELCEVSAVCVPACASAVAVRRSLALAEREAQTRMPMPEDTDTKPVADATVATDPTEHTKALEAERAKLADSEKAASDLRLEVKAAQEFAVQMRNERDAAVVKSAAIETERDSLAARHIERDVDDLVGKKLTPAQRDEFLALAKENRKAFELAVKTLPFINLTTPIVPAAKSEPSSIGTSASEELASRLAKS